MSRVIICDRCGAVIPNGGKVGKIAWAVTDTGSGAVEDIPYDGMDFCAVCMGAIRQLIEERPKEPDPPKMRGSWIDAGKIMALYRTGQWTYEKIAEECGCSPSTVQKIVREGNKQS